MKIVISADGGREGDAARRWCAENLGPGDEAIAVLGAEQFSTMVLSVSPVMAAVDQHALRESVERRLHEDFAPRGVSYECRVGGHSQARAVAETAEAEHADLIVVGKRPHSVITDAVANETALHLVHRPPCPIVVVPAP
jgi:nucleotide-binding universal stress UspA family protein